MLYPTQLCPLSGAMMLPHWEKAKLRYKLGLKVAGKSKLLKRPYNSGRTDVKFKSSRLSSIAILTPFFFKNRNI